MQAVEILEVLKGLVPDGAVEPAPAADGMPAIYVAREHAPAVCLVLRDNPALQFAFAPDITAADFMPRNLKDDQAYTAFDVSDPVRPRELGRWWYPGTEERDEAPPVPRHPAPRGACALPPSLGRRTQGTSCRPK